MRLLADGHVLEDPGPGGHLHEPLHLLVDGDRVGRVVEPDERRVPQRQLLDLVVDLAALLEIRLAQPPGEQRVHLRRLVPAVVRLALGEAQLVGRELGRIGDVVGPARDVDLELVGAVPRGCRGPVERLQLQVDADLGPHLLEGHRRRLVHGVVGAEQDLEVDRRGDPGLLERAAWPCSDRRRCPSSPC